MDDNSSVRRILVRVFELDDFDVSWAANGEEALPLIEENRVDIMICDIKMPKMDGRELMQHLKMKGPYIPERTYIITSHSMLEEREWISGFPGLSLVEKPVGPRRLLRLVKDVETSESAR